MSDNLEKKSKLPFATQKSLFYLAIYSIFFSFFIRFFLACMCGHLGRGQLIGSAIVSFSSWYSFTRFKEKSIIKRIVIMMAVIISTVLLAKNLADVLWFGHDAIFDVIERIYL